MGGSGGSGGGMADALGGLGEGLGGLFGYWASAGNREKAQQDYENALAGYQNLNAQQQGNSAYDAIRMDPSGRQAQLDALSNLQNVYRSQGLDAGTRAQLNQVQQSNAQQAQAAQGAIQNRMQQQGLASSGANFAAQRGAAQTAAMGNYNQGVNAAALGANRQMQALQGAGQLGGQMQQQDWKQASDRAAATDAIARFNTASQNQMAQYRAGGMQSAYDNMAGNQTQQGQQLMGVDAGVGRGVGQSAGAGMDYFQNFFGGGGGGGGAGGAASAIGSMV